MKRAAIVVVVAAAAGACTSLAGLDDLRFEPEASAGGGGSGTAHGGQGGGGTGGSSTGMGGTGGVGAAGGSGGSLPPRPSCEGLGESCGPAADQSCCAGELVPGGTFDRSNDPSYPATVSSFVLDRYQITVGRFRKFVDAGHGTQATPPAQDSGELPNLPGSGWQTAWNSSLEADTSALKGAVKCSTSFQTWTDTPAGNETRPMNCITWFEAFAFCIWDGGRLPTEAEWNYAAAGGSEQREYPWSSPPSSTSIDCTHASYDCPNTPCGDGTTGCAVTDFVMVGSKPAGDGRWGHADLGGNVWEFLLDWYDVYPNPCDDCANLTPDWQRACRGGDFRFSNASHLLTSYRAGCLADDRAGYAGARCARTP